MLHSFAAYYPDQPSSEDKESMLGILRGYRNLYPCTHCRAHFQKDYDKGRSPSTQTRLNYRIGSSFRCGFAGSTTTWTNCWASSDSSASTKAWCGGGGRGATRETATSDVCSIILQKSHSMQLPPLLHLHHLLNRPTQMVALYQLSQTTLVFLGPELPAVREYSLQCIPDSLDLPPLQ